MDQEKSVALGITKKQADRYAISNILKIEGCNAMLYIIIPMEFVKIIIRLKNLSKRYSKRI